MTKKLIHSSYLQYLKTLSVKLKEDQVEKKKDSWNCLLHWYRINKSCNKGGIV